MIPGAYVQEWSATTPWPDPRQVEQDLIICRALCDIFNDPWLSERLAFRGGLATTPAIILARSDQAIRSDSDALSDGARRRGHARDTTGAVKSGVPCRHSRAARAEKPFAIVYGFSDPVQSMTGEGGTDRTPSAVG